MSYDEIISQVSKETSLPRAFVNKVYRAYWKGLREHICSLPLKEDLTDEQFKGLQTTINLPSLGKLFVTLDNYKKLKYVYNKLKTQNNVTHKED